MANMTKATAIKTAALTARVTARKRGYIDLEMCWDAIAELGDLGVIKISAKSVLHSANKELEAQGVYLPIR